MLFLLFFFTSDMVKLNKPFLGVGGWSNVYVCVCVCVCVCVWFVWFGLTFVLFVCVFCFVFFFSCDALSSLICEQQPYYRN